jgi:hypothetical protein
MTNFKPVRLYIKQHAITGLKYFGKSVSQNIEKYNGSGTHWRRHISKHGKQYVNTIWVSEWFYKKEDIKEFAEFFSEFNDIIESSKWANLKIEDGLEGGWDHLSGENNPMKNAEIRKKVSDATTGKYIGDKHHGFGKTRPEHSLHMTKLGFGKNKTKEHLDNHARVWIKTTKDNPIRALNWNILKDNVIMNIRNLKKFCKEHHLNYLQFYRGIEINGFRLLGKQ